MRRIRKWVMILALCLAVTGCGFQENDEQKEETESAKQTVMQTEQEDNEAGAVQSKPQKSSVDTPQSVDKAFAYINADGQLCLWQQGSQVPVVLAEHWLSADNTALLMGYTKEELESMLSSVELEGIKKIIYTKDRQGIYFPSNFLFYPLGSTELRPTYELIHVGEDTYEINKEGSLTVSKMVKFTQRKEEYQGEMRVLQIVAEIVDNMCYTQCKNNDLQSFF